MTPIIYLAHPVGAPTVEGVLLNVARAERWFRAIAIAEPNVVVFAPWLPYVRTLDDRDPAHRARGIRDDHAIIERIRPNGIVLCGGRISTGMSAELELVKRQRGWISDLTHLGVEPPDDLGRDALAIGQAMWQAREVGAA